MFLKESNVIKYDNGGKQMDKKPLIPKWSAIGVILLFLGTSIIPATAQNMDNLLPTSKGITIYVDDDNVLGPWDGTLSHPYRTIQDGLNVSENGDTVYVFNGTYDHAGIRHSINLVGESRKGTIITSYTFIGNGVNWVNISGFTIKGDYALSVDGEHCCISDNIIQGRYSGLESQYTQNNTFKNNVIANCGVGLWIGGYNEIVNNTIINNTVGIHCVNGNNEIYNNNFTQNSNALNLASSYNNVYRNNFFKNNRKSDAVGVTLEFFGIGNKIHENNFIKNFYYNVGFSLDLSDLSKDKNIIDNNYWSRYKGFGSKPLSGIVTLFVFYIHTYPFWIPIYITVPWIICDKNPAQEPYDIPGMS